MSEQHWDDLLPFYAAGLLSPQERAAVEAYLARSEDARHQLELWRLLARGIHVEASRAKTLPPLPQSFRAGLTPQPYISKNGHSTAALPTEIRVSQLPTEVRSLPRLEVMKRRTGEKMNPARRIVGLPMTAAAAVLIVCFVGMLLAAAMRNSGMYGAPPEHTRLPTLPVETLEPDATFTTEPLVSDTPGLATPTIKPSTTPTGTATHRDTRTPTETPTGEWKPCTITAEQSTIIYLDPDYNSQVINSIVGSYIPEYQTTTGWYHIQVYETIGWVYFTDVLVTGDCASLPVVTPGPIVTPMIECYVSPNNNGQPINVYEQPGWDSTVVGVLQPDQIPAVAMRTADGWYAIGIRGGYYDWVHASMVSTFNRCDLIPVATPSFPSTPTPTPELPPPMFTTVPEGVTCLPGETVRLNFGFQPFNLAHVGFWASLDNANAALINNIEYDVNVQMATVIVQCQQAGQTALLTAYVYRIGDVDFRDLSNVDFSLASSVVVSITVGD